MTASRMEQLALEAPVHLTVLERETLLNTAAVTVDDSLRQVPGFSLFRRASSVTAHPTSQGVSLRGIGPSGASRTLVLYDGIPLNDPFGGWIYWSRVSKESLGRVELVRGGGSNVWGSSALGGVIHLLTRKNDGFRFGALLEAGEDSLLQADASLSDRREKVDYSLHGRSFDTHGYPVVRQDQRGAIDVPAFSEHRLFSGRVGFRAADSVSGFLRAALFDEERGNGTPLTGNDTENTSFGSGVDWLVGESAWHFRLFGQEQEFASTFSAQEADRSAERPALDQFLVESESLGLSLQWTRALTADRGHAVTAGGEVRKTEGQTNEDFFFSGVRFNNRRQAGGEETLAGVYLQDNWSVGERWQVSLGARLDLWRSEEGFRFEHSLVTGLPRRDDSFEDREETTVSPKLGFVYEASDRARLRGAVYRAFRAPTINELYRPFRVRNDITEANALLDPEVLTGGELGATIDGREWRLNLAGFWNRLEDPIANVTIATATSSGVIAPCGFVPGGGSCRQRQNLDRTRVLGFEADLDWPLAPSWRLKASYLYDDAEVSEASGRRDLEGKTLAQVPKHQLVTRLAYLPRAGSGVAHKFHGSLQARYVSEQFEDDLNQRELDELVVFDALIGFLASPRWSIFAAAENLTDEEIEVGRSSAGLVTIGAPRLLRLGVRLSIDR